MPERPFWKTADLSQLSRTEWEALCDGCGYCCLIKLEDEESDKLYVTNVACRLLDLDSCRCRDYARRSSVVAQCLALSPDKPELYQLLPETCAYRRLSRGLDLPDWHPLLSREENSVQAAGISVCHYAFSEEYIHPEQLPEHVLHEHDRE
ncbi:MAG: YcgN family cysteine cluster protein [Gammaproteobacteria bacterium]|nr:YcgN family cysteine cluster protein [Gammaproteobacteria bacterium]MDH5651705.1 YcgN family cysteine cluster protein [Gammaproteobacteria bacterium]